MGRGQKSFLLATLVAAIFFADSVTARQQESQDASKNESFDDRMNLYTKWAQTAHGRKLSDAYTPSTSPRVNPPAPSIGGGCKVLRYVTGYANLTLYYNKIIKDTPNFGECCKSCQADPNCLAWTRVAGGEPPNFRNCYLKYSINALDQSPNARDHNHVGHPRDDISYPELRYVNQNYPTILESGTIPDLYPAEYYGCPYPPGNAGLPCDGP